MTNTGVVVESPRQRAGSVMPSLWTTVGSEATRGCDSRFSLRSLSPPPEAEDGERRKNGRSALTYVYMYSGVENVEGWLGRATVSRKFARLAFPVGEKLRTYIQGILNETWSE